MEMDNIEDYQSTLATRFQLFPRNCGVGGEGKGSLVPSCIGPFCLLFHLDLSSIPLASLQKQPKV